MKVDSGRSLALDFFRGLAMLIIVVDHIGGSILSRFTLHRFAFSDAAEAFVFLSGFAIASAWLKWSEQGTAAASWRLLGRVWPIYRGFLICSALMLACAAVFQGLDIHAPNLPMASLVDLSTAPLRYTVDLLLLQHQPYLASVLPMYVMFLLIAPLSVPLGLRQPLLALLLSLAAWGLVQGATQEVAPGWVISMNVAIDKGEWSFNPLAWQCMFMLGVIGRSAMVQSLGTRRYLRHGLTIVAIGIVLACAIWRLWVEPGYLNGALKENLSLLRVCNFVALAWGCAQLAQTAWFTQIIQCLGWVAAVGRHSMTCFIAGAVISLVLDSILFHATAGELNYPAGLFTDGVALLLIAVCALALEKGAARRRRLPTVAKPVSLA